MTDTSIVPSPPPVRLKQANEDEHPVMDVFIEAIIALGKAIWKMLTDDRSGSLTTYGRTIDWKAHSHWRAFKLVWDGTATDAATGLSETSINHKSPDGAVEWAVRDLAKTLKVHGYLQ